VRFSCRFYRFCVFNGYRPAPHPGNLQHPLRGDVSPLLPVPQARSSGIPTVYGDNLDLTAQLEPASFLEVGYVPLADIGAVRVAVGVR
jgi:hypothetical protein